MKALKKALTKYSVEERRAFPFLAVILFLPVLQTIIFFVYVNFSSISLAFQNPKGERSLYAFKMVFDTFRTGTDTNGLKIWEIFGKSIFIWCINNFVNMPISWFFCFVLTKHMIGSKAFRLSYYVPGIVGTVVFSMIMKDMYMAEGVVMTILEKLHINFSDDVLRNGLLGSENTAFKTLMIQSIVLGIAGGDMITAGAYAKIPEEIFESARLDGCGFFRETFQIAVPCIWPTISTLYTFALCSFFVADWSFYLYSNGTGGKGLVSGSFYFYKLQATIAERPTDANSKRLYVYSSALGLVVTAITVPLVLYGKKLLAKISDDVEF